MTAPRVLHAAPVALLAALQAACAVGFSGYRTGAVPKGGPLRIPATAAFTLQNEGGEVVNALDRALRGRAGVIDVRRAAPSDPTPTDRFVIRVDGSYDTPGWSTALFLTSFLTFAVVPGVGVSYSRIRFVVEAPRGYERTYEYGYREWLVTWLPLVLLCPNTLASTGDSAIQPEEARQRTIDAIVNRFLEEVSPFVVAHATWGAP